MKSLLKHNEFRTLIICLVLITLASCGNGVSRSSSVADVGNGNNTDPDNNPIYSSWVKQFGSITKGFAGADHSLYDSCFSTAIDTSGNFYCSGYAEGSVGELNGGTTDAFIIKVNSEGTLQWIRQLGSATAASSPHVVDASGYEYCINMTVDSANNVYCVGLTTGNLAETPGGGYDGFVVKLNSSGEIQWLKQFGSDTAAASPHINSTASSDELTGVAVDSSGNVYCVGRSQSNFAEANGGNHDIILIKLNSSGDIQWAKQFGSATATASPHIQSSAGSEEMNSIVIDSSGNLIMAGATDNSFGEASGGGYDALIVKTNSSGDIQWVRQIGSSTTATSPYVDNTNSFEKLKSVALDSSGNIYCGGATYSSFGETAGGSSDGMIVKLDSSGVVSNVFHLGNDTETSSPLILNTAGAEDCYYIKIDSSDNVYCSGNGPGIAETASGWDWNAFVLKLDSSFNILWIKEFGAVTFASPNYFATAVYGLEIGSDGSIFVAGESYGELNEPDGGGEMGDIFMAKITPDGQLDI